MIRDTILGALSATKAGESPSTLVASCELPVEPEVSAALEVLLEYSPETIRDGDKWRLAQAGRTATILAAIENFSVSTGRKIFRLSSALRGIPPHEQPTEDELKQALGMSHGKYELLPNAMIKRNS